MNSFGKLFHPSKSSIMFPIIGLLIQKETNGCLKPFFKIITAGKPF